MTKSICSLCLLVFLFGCIKDNPQEKDADGVLTHKFDVSLAKSTSLNSWVDSVEVLQLEETANSLLGEFVSISESEDNYFLTDSERKKLILFSKKGDFIRQINHFGEGEGAYSTIWGYWTENENIAVYDSPKSSILYYDFFGKFIERKVLSYFPRFVFEYNSKLFLDVSINPVPELGEFTVLIMNAKGEVISKEIPYLEEPKLNMGWGYNSFAEGLGGLIYHNPVSDTVFKLGKDGTFNPIVRFDFGDYWFWGDSFKEELKMKSPKELLLFSRQVEAIKSLSVLFSQDQYLCQFVYVDRLYSILGNISTGEHKYIDAEDVSDRDIRFRPIKWQEEKLLVSYNSRELRTLLRGLDSEKVSFKGSSTLHGIESAENPCLVWLKFK